MQLLHITRGAPRSASRCFSPPFRPAQYFPNSPSISKNVDKSARGFENPAIEAFVENDLLGNLFSIAQKRIKTLYVILSEANRNAVCEVEVLRSEQRSKTKER